MSDLTAIFVKTSVVGREQGLFWVSSDLTFQEFTHWCIQVYLLSVSHLCVCHCSRL